MRIITIYYSGIASKYLTIALNYVEGILAN